MHLRSFSTSSSSSSLHACLWMHSSRWSRFSSLFFSFLSPFFPDMPIPSHPRTHSNTFPPFFCPLRMHYFWCVYGARQIRTTQSRDTAQSMKLFFFFFVWLILCFHGQVEKSKTRIILKRMRPDLENFLIWRLDRIGAELGVDTLARNCAAVISASFN